MPSEERLRLHDREETTPVISHDSATRAIRVASSARRGLPAASTSSASCFSEQILGGELPMRASRRRDQPQESHARRRTV